MFPSPTFIWESLTFNTSGWACIPDEKGQIKWWLGYSDPLGWVPHPIRLMSLEENQETPGCVEGKGHVRTQKVLSSPHSVDRGLAENKPTYTLTWGLLASSTVLR